ncbi:MAG TPA: DPP IV N-terminal domain-containing protein [Longimicrobiales bacterium]|nr:DPP IV N-terminal domain-containing protein [Longimicrobiales bacterium]
MKPAHDGRVRVAAAFLFALALLAPVQLGAQDRLKTYPGYERYARMAPQLAQAVTRVALTPRWAEDGRSFEYQLEGRWYRYDIARRGATVIATPTADPGAGLRLGGPERGRQYTEAISPDSTKRAFYRDRNLWLSARDGSGEHAVTTEGSAAERTKFGSGSWVYGEELDQNTAMWWSPDGSRIAYYGFDESPVTDYHLQLDQTKLVSTMDIEAYPKAGAPNPIVDLWVYDLATRERTKLDIRMGGPFANEVVGYYAYQVGWTPDGSEVTLNRTNRRQNIMEFTACHPGTGACRVIVREEWLPSWTENHPPMQYLADGRRFLWTSERTGFRNLYLYDLTGKLLATLTKHAFDVGSIVRVDERAGHVYYLARSGDNHMKVQLHRVGLNGRGDVRLTDPALHHTVSMAPDGAHFVVTSQAHDRAPVTTLLDRQGRTVAELARTDLTKYRELGVQPVELFTFTAADGRTTLHALLHRPSNFDPSQRYPVLVAVYNGPGTNGVSESFATPHPFTELGFLVMTLDARSAGGRGKRFLDAIYQKLGVTEIDDIAAGVRALRERPYVDGGRVGIYGTSYGGYAAVMALFRYPDVFHAASAMSPVTHWKHYDTIYTERYMWIPQENAEGYENGSALKYVNDLKGRLMLYYGTADNNVHPNNSMELIAALQQAGRSFEVQVGPDRGHTTLNPQRMLEFFIENLVLQPQPVM